MPIGSSPDNGMMKHSVVFNQIPLVQDRTRLSPHIVCGSWQNISVDSNM